MWTQRDIVEPSTHIPHHFPAACWQKLKTVIKDVRLQIINECKTKKWKHQETAFSRQNFQEFQSIPLRETNRPVKTFCISKKHPFSEYKRVEHYHKCTKPTVTQCIKTPNGPEKNFTPPSHSLQDTQTVGFVMIIRWQQQQSSPNHNRNEHQHHLLALLAISSHAYQSCPATSTQKSWYAAQPHKKKAHKALH